MIRRIDDLWARTPNGRQLMESLVWLGAAIDETHAEAGGRTTGAVMAPATSSPTEPSAQPRWVRRLWGYMILHRRDVVLALAAAVSAASARPSSRSSSARSSTGSSSTHTRRCGRGSCFSSVWPAALRLRLSAPLPGWPGGLGVQYDLRNAMHDHLQVMDFDNLDRMPTGQLVARANSDSTLVQGLLSFFPIMSGNVLLMLFSLASWSTCRHCWPW
jgi:ATP-binding cassette subfamily B protein